MKKLLEKVSSTASATVTLKGSMGCVRTALALLKGLEACNSGMSREFTVYWDGDGADSLHVEGTPYVLPKQAMEDLANSNGLSLSPGFDNVSINGV